MDFTYEATGSFLQHPGIVLTILILAALAVAYTVRNLAFAVLRRVLSRTPDGRGAILAARLRTASLIWLFVLFLTLATPFVGVEAGSPFYHRLTLIILIGAVGSTLLGLVHAWADVAARKFQLDAGDNLEARKFITRLRILRRLGAVFIGVITVAAMLMAIPSVRSYGVSLFASAGVMGIVIGFAARPVLSNLLAGLQIALAQPIRIDDVVIVEGEWGWVEEITATYVVVRLWDWRRLIVPLSYFIEKPFQNWTRESASLIGSVFWEMDYTVPVERVREKLKALLADHRLWDGDVANLQVTDSKERTILLRALMSARSSPEAWDLRCDIREKMIAWLQTEYPDALPRIRADLGERDTAPETPAPEPPPASAS